MGEKTVDRLMDQLALRENTLQQAEELCHALIGCRSWSYNYGLRPLVALIPLLAAESRPGRNVPSGVVIWLWVFPRQVQWIDYDRVQTFAFPDEVNDLIHNLSRLQVGNEDHSSDLIGLL